jgi:hypothetical protein
VIVYLATLTVKQAPLACSVARPVSWKTKKMSCNNCLIRHGVRQEGNTRSLNASMAATKTPLRPRGRGGHATWGHRLALSKESYNALKLLFMTSKRDMIVYFSLKYFTLRRNICQQNKCLCRRLRRSESLAYKAWTSTFLSPLEAAIWVGKKMDMSKVMRSLLLWNMKEERERERKREN